MEENPEKISPEREIPPLQKLLSHPTIILCVALVLAMVPASLGVAGVINMTLAYILLVVCFFAVLAICYVGRSTSLLTEKSVMIILPTAILFFMILGALEFFLHPQQDTIGAEKEKPTNQQTPQTTAKEIAKEVIDLHKLFDNEFSTLMRVTTDRVIEINYDNKPMHCPNFINQGQGNILTKVPQPLSSNLIFDVKIKKTLTSNPKRDEPGGTKITIYEQEYQDYQGKSKFIGYYIPLSPYSYKICEALSTFYKTTMDDFDSIAEIRFGRSTESTVTSASELAFTGRVYIYYEGIITLQELAALERLYQSKGVSVVLRGPAYLNSVLGGAQK
jgi:hypothetical protein